MYTGRRGSALSDSETPGSDTPVQEPGGCNSLALANEILKHMEQSSYPGLPGTHSQFTARTDAGSMGSVPSRQYS